LQNNSTLRILKTSMDRAGLSKWRRNIWNRQSYEL